MVGALVQRPRSAAEGLIPFLERMARIANLCVRPVIALLLTRIRGAPHPRPSARIYSSLPCDGFRVLEPTVGALTKLLLKSVVAPKSLLRCEEKKKKKGARRLREMFS